MKYEKAFVGRMLKQLLVIGILLTFSGCYVPMGSIVILENPGGTGVAVNLYRKKPEVNCFYCNGIGNGQI